MLNIHPFVAFFSGDASQEDEQCLFLLGRDKRRPVQCDIGDSRTHRTLSRQAIFAAVLEVKARARHLMHRAGTTPPQDFAVQYVCLTRCIIYRNLLVVQLNLRISHRVSMSCTLGLDCWPIELLKFVPSQIRWLDSKIHLFLSRLLVSVWAWSVSIPSLLRQRLFSPSHTVWRGFSPTQ